MKKGFRVLLKWFALCLVAGAIVVGAFYFTYRTSSVLIENQSGVIVSNIRVELGNETFWTGTLVPGESHREFGFVRPVETGSLTVSFTANGVSRERDFASGSSLRGSDHRIAITSALQIDEVWIN